MLSALVRSLASNESPATRRVLSSVIESLQQSCQLHAHGSSEILQNTCTHPGIVSAPGEYQQVAPVQKLQVNSEMLRSRMQHAHGGFSMMQKRFGHTIRHVGHGMHNRATWAKVSDDKDRHIVTLQSLEQLEAFWSAYGGASPEVWKRLSRKLKGRLPNLKAMERPPELQPCKLSYLNLAKFIRQLSYVLPPGVMSSPTENHSNLVALPAPSAVAAGGSQKFVLRDHLVPKAQRLLDEACGHLLRRGKLCDPETAGQVLFSLGKLGYTPSAQLITLLLNRAAVRVEEAFLKDLAVTAEFANIHKVEEAVLSEGLRLLGYTGGSAWWSAAWRQAGTVLPTGMYDVNHVHKLLRSAEALGHVPPEPIRALTTKVLPERPQQQAKALA